MHRTTVNTWTVLILVAMFLPQPSEAQPCQMPVTRAWLTVADTQIWPDTLWFGFDSTATSGIDPPLCEEELPPIPPTGIFDARFVGIPGRIDLGQGVKCDYRRYYSRTQIDTHKIRFQPSVPPGYPMRFQWSRRGLLAICDSARLIDEVGGLFVNVRMQNIDTARLTQSSLSYLLLVRYGAKAFPAAPSIPNLLSPPTGSTGQPRSITFRWNSTQYASYYDIQVSTDSLFQSGFFVNDSLVTDTLRFVSGLPFGTTYYWKVLARNIIGSASSMRWNFTTQLQVPSPPMLISPPESARVVPTSPQFLWHSSLSADRYWLEVGADTTIFFRDTTLTDTTRIAGPFPYLARLPWRVRARNSSGWGPFSAAWLFWVMASPPAAPTLSSPNNNQTNVGLTGPLCWLTVPYAACYRLQIALDTLMTNIFINDSCTFGLVRLAPLTVYFWRVRAINPEGTPGPWSVTWRFTTISSATLSPIPTYPANGDTGVVREPTLCWIGSPGAARYWLQLALAANFLPPLVRDDSVLIDTSTCSSVGILQSNTLYYWRVCARNAIGWSAWSDTSRFTTGSILGVTTDRTSIAPDEFWLSQNHPNPFNPSTNIRYEVPRESHVTLRIHNVLGQEVAALVNELRQPGRYQVQWNAENFSSGVYFYRLQAGDFVQTKKLMVVK